MRIPTHFHAADQLANFKTRIDQIIPISILLHLHWQEDRLANFKTRVDQILEQYNAEHEKLARRTYQNSKEQKKAQNDLIITNLLWEILVTAWKLGVYQFYFAPDELQQPDNDLEPTLIKACKDIACLSWEYAKKIAYDPENNGSRNPYTYFFYRIPLQYSDITEAELIEQSQHSLTPNLDGKITFAFSPDYQKLIISRPPQKKHTITAASGSHIPSASPLDDILPPHPPTGIRPHAKGRREHSACAILNPITFALSYLVGTQWNWEALQQLFKVILLKKIELLGLGKDKKDKTTHLFATMPENNIIALFNKIQKLDQTDPFTKEEVAFLKVVIQQLDPRDYQSIPFKLNDERKMDLLGRLNLNHELGLKNFWFNQCGRLFGGKRIGFKGTKTQKYFRGRVPNRIFAMLDYINKDSQKPLETRDSYTIFKETLNTLRTTETNSSSDKQGPFSRFFKYSNSITFGRTTATTRFYAADDLDKAIATLPQISN